MIIKGIDTNNDARPLLLSSTGEVIVSAASLTTTGGKIQVDAGGIVRIEQSGYYDDVALPVLDQVSNTNLAAGLNILSSTVVPDGQKWVLKNISFRYVGTITSVFLFPAVVIGGGQCRINSVNPVVSGQYYSQVCDILLDAGDGVILVITSATAGNDAYLDTVYRRIK